MYRRSYPYNITEKQRTEFMEKVKEGISEYGYYNYINDYPYDMCRNKKVKTEHITVFYKDMHNIIWIINQSRYRGYTVITNSRENQSIPEINHLHLIKTIDEN